MRDQTINDKTRSSEHHHRDIDMEGLARELKSQIQGEVRFDKGYRALYATDGSNYRMEPMGVVIPKSREDVINTVRIARKFQAPLLNRGGGTSLAGQCTNTAVILDLSKYYNRILEIDPEKRTARVQPGVILDDLRDEAEKYGLTFGPDPSTHNHCTIGGMIGNNSCGVHSVMAVKFGKGARTSDNIRSMEVLTYDGEVMNVGPVSEQELPAIIAGGGRKGEIYEKLRDIRDTYAAEIRKRYPKIPRRVSGYNLDELLPENQFNVARALAGSEGTLITILEATLELIPFPEKRGLLVIGYSSVFDAARHVPEILKLDPVGLEGLDEELIHFMQLKHLATRDIKLLPEGKGWLIAEFGGDTQQEVNRQLRQASKAVRKESNGYLSMAIFESESEEEEIWTIRESGLGATAFVPGRGDAWPGWEDSAVPPERTGDYLKDLRELFHKHGYHASLYGHFGQGLVHCRINFDLSTERGLKNYYTFLNDATDLVIRYGGSYSGEHGDGQARAEFLQKMFGPEIIKAFLEFKQTWDPKNRMNPGKVIDPDSALSNLRLGTDYYPWEGKTYYQYPNDQGRFSRAVLRCVGVGKCRRSGGGTMCPSYMVTKEEMHSTRGRTHLLFELTTGKTIKDGWKNETIKESLDLCLSCKGCKGDCPVNVDVATYRSEFFAHYYKNRIRPLHAYAFGYIAFWARIGSAIPELTNRITHAPSFGTLIKQAAGIAPQREVPVFARQTFKQWFFNEAQNNPPSEKKLIFWADTFNNYFHAEVAKAAVNLLINAGWHVIVPTIHLCCGRPLYDFGMIGTARRWLKKIILTLREEIRNGTPLVGIEPSCMATFKDELISLFPKDEDARRLSQQAYIFSDFILKENPDFRLPVIGKKAIVHGHCHRKAIFTMDSETELLQKMEVDYQLLDSGCCGMAGAFGFEKEKYDISVKVGERVLLPAVRDMEEGTLLLANGFSCKEQIRQLSSGRAIHIAELIDRAIRNQL